MKRVRKKKIDYGRLQIYGGYKKQHKSTALEIGLYSKILNSFNKKLSQLILEEAFEYIMPSRLGVLRIKKYKPQLVDKNGNIKKRMLHPNWKATNELWASNPTAKESKKLVYHTNEHSDGYEYKWHFSNYRSTCKNKSAYCFIPSRDNKRAITALVTDEDFTGDYFM